MRLTDSAPLIAIACGGTGGHLFPGLALSEVMRARGIRCQLLVSTKRVDRDSLGTLLGSETAAEALPAVGWDWRRPWRFARGLWQAGCRVRARFRDQPPAAVVTMGGFTGVAPALAGLRWGVPVFLHESNAMPGRANRWLARRSCAAFVGFPQAAGRLSAPQVWVCGTPVRPEIHPRVRSVCREALGLDGKRATLLVMGGSQGAQAIDRLVVGALEFWRTANLEMQFIHLTGRESEAAVRSAYARHGFGARVAPFLREIHLALGAADLAVSRAGASSLAELAAVRLPAILVPYPGAVDDHQVHNARAYAEAGAVRWRPQAGTSPRDLADEVAGLMGDSEQRAEMAAALARWHRPRAAVEMADVILGTIDPGRGVGARGAASPGCVAAGGSGGDPAEAGAVLEPSGVRSAGGEGL